MNAKLAAALVAAQNDLHPIAKDSTNPHFKNKYASLDVIIETVRPILAQHELALVQGGEMAADGKTLVVATTLVHITGGAVTTKVSVPLVKMDPQGAGGALTYGRRYGISALLCLACDEDDDGNNASRPAAAKRAPAPKPAAAESNGAKHAPPTKWLGLAKERPMPFGSTKGKPLGEHSRDHLESLAKWCANRPGFEDFLRDVRRVLADMSLGTDTIPDTSDRIVAKMHADTEKDEAPLTALLDSPRK